MQISALFVAFVKDGSISAYHNDFLSLVRSLTVCFLEVESAAPIASARLKTMVS